MDSKFRLVAGLLNEKLGVTIATPLHYSGKYLEVVPTGISHLIFKNTGDHYTWTKVWRRKAMFIGPSLTHTPALGLHHHSQHHRWQAVDGESRRDDHPQPHHRHILPPGLQGLLYLQQFGGGKGWELCAVRAYSLSSTP